MTTACEDGQIRLANPRHLHIKIHFYKYLYLLFCFFINLIHCKRFSGILTSILLDSSAFFVILADSSWAIIIVLDSLGFLNRMCFLFWSISMSKYSTVFSPKWGARHAKRAFSPARTVTFKAGPRRFWWTIFLDASDTLSVRESNSSYWIRHNRTRAGR